MDESTAGSGVSEPVHRGGGARTVLAWLIILALAALVLYLLSERNARRYFLVPESGSLIVKKGLFLPAGEQPFKTSDAQLAQAYAPLEPPPGEALPREEQSFDDRAALDQAIYELLAKWARADVQTDRPERLDRALAYLNRADRLAGLTPAQRDDLRNLRAESGYYEARRLIAQAADALRAARDKLKLAGESTSRHAAEALDLLQRVDRVADDVLRVARAAATEFPAPQSGAEATAPETEQNAAPAPAADAGAPADGGR